MQQTLLILDFGSQYTQLIARRAREMGVYSLIVSHRTTLKKIQTINPTAIILSGGPNSVYAKGAPKVDKRVFELGIPVLGICYGLQIMAHHLGGKVEASTTREYGKAQLHVLKANKLLLKKYDKSTFWMSHGDHVVKPPKGFEVIAKSGDIVCAIANTQKQLFGLQFHPEVSHSKYGNDLLQHFFMLCGFACDYKPKSIIDTQVEHVRTQVGEDKVICALSGGVDSSVAATLVHRAIGNQQVCIFVDNGLLRLNEFEEVLAGYRQMGLNVKPVRAAHRFLSKLKGVTDPEKKRKIIGTEFIRVFEEEAKKIKGAKYLVQGTLYTDVIESVPVHGASVTIKSHHNVGGLPKRMQLALIEPLRELFKDEVRVIGKTLGLPASIVQRQPFPGPGLAIRILGEITKPRLELLRKADAIVREEILHSSIHKQVWQFFAVLLPIKSVGVMGDGRTYEQVIAVRAISSVDGMTAHWSHLPHTLLERISSRIISEVTGINRVVYDITSKPPGTIEWE